MTAEQITATTPTASVWVVASAGTGKTKVLTDRVLRLMLSGTAPERILCLTFTRAAAAEMAERISRILATWTILDDANLARSLIDLTAETPESEQVDAARRLFARVLDAPGGLKIQTIHAFCQSLLARFPMEARIVPRFEAIDERTASEALAETREEILSRAFRGESADELSAALFDIAIHIDERRFSDLTAVLTADRSRLRRFLHEHGGQSGAIGAVFDRLRVERTETPETVLAAACSEDAFDGPALRRVAEAMVAGSASDHRNAETIRTWLERCADRLSSFGSYSEVFLTKADGDLRQRLVSKQLKDSNPGIAEVLEVEGRRLREVVSRHNIAAIARSTAALIVLGRAMLEAYDRHKAARGQLDYDDLILAVRDLLRDPGVAPWILFKLDGGLDHILVDEAQDTNPEQWEIIAGLAAEFFAGTGAREENRTVFAVGDPKQSIFSFQRADPEAYKKMRSRFARQVKHAGKTWIPVSLDASFRSTEAVLQAVDAVFAQPAARRGVAQSDEMIKHDWVRVGQAGLVELWPPVPAGEKPVFQPWDVPAGRRVANSPRTRLARLIAHKIRQWTRLEATAEEAWLESRGRQVRPDDIIILVRQRKAIVEEIVRELKLLGVPVAGVDRMILTEQLPVMDLIALGQFLLLPEDDLTLATVLKCPLVGLAEEQLFKLAYGRKASLWDELVRRAASDSVFRSAHAWLSALLKRADFVPPYELYADVLGQGGRRRLLARLGPDAEDPIDEFMSLALAYERIAPPSLQGFLHWVAAAGTEVKRELEQSRGAVRVMTVHGAKGLQAPIVLLPDTLQVPRPDDAPLWPDGVMLWPPRASYDCSIAAAARQAARQHRDEEYRRLLYVAMTRAEDRLYVCGWHGQKTESKDCWYSLVRDGLRAVAGQVDFDFSREISEGWSGTGLRLVNPQAAEAELELSAPLGPTEEGVLPDWVTASASPEPTLPRFLTPSRPEELEPAVLSPLESDNGTRFRRGLAIHRLLQRLPEVDIANREGVGRRYLANRKFGFAAHEQEDILNETLAVLSDANFGRIFGPGSRAEVSLTGQIGARLVSGQLDRLLITESDVWAVDFKTNRAVPDQEEEVPAIYLRQIACYRGLLRQIYPDRPVRCGLLWTDGPRLLALSDELVDRYAP